MRLKPETREEFRVAAELRGATMSGLLHQFIVRTIREEKERDPEAFARLKNTDLSEGDQPSRQPFDPRFHPVQAALYKRFPSEHKAEATKKSKEVPSNSGPAHSNEIVQGKNKYDKGGSQRGSKGGEQ